MNRIFFVKYRFIGLVSIIWTCMMISGWYVIQWRYQNRLQCSNILALQNQLNHQSLILHQLRAESAAQYNRLKLEQFARAELDMIDPHELS